MKLSQTNKVKLLLTSVVITLIVLSSLLVHTLSADILLSVRVFSLLAYALSFAAFRVYLAWFEPIKQLQAYVHAKQQGQSNISLHFNDSNAPLALLSKQLTAVFEQQQATQHPLFFSLLKSWPTPIAVFDQSQSLCFFNHSMYQHLKQPILVGMTQAETGFSINQSTVSHGDFNQQWQLQLFKLAEHGYTLISAVHIGDQLKHAKRESQANLIRILSHELTNSLTPMSSMADTLLSFERLPENQTRKALTRVKSRSEALLSFIKSYASLSRLPNPTKERFNLKEQANTCALEQGVGIQFNGEAFLFADKVQIEQVLINLIKNAKEATEESSKITLNSQVFGRWQHLSLSDNGPGFANLDNALTPLYTTKQSGVGLGLAICQDIIERHDGLIELANHKNGAKITIRLPL